MDKQLLELQVQVQRELAAFDKGPDRLLTTHGFDYSGEMPAADSNLQAELYYRGAGWLTLHILVSDSMRVSNSQDV